MNARTNTWMGLLASCLMAVFLLAHAPVVQAAAPTFLAAGSAVNGTGSVTTAWPSGHDTGDVALLFIESTCGESTPTLSTAAGFTLLDTQDTGCTAATGTRLTVYWARATSNAMSSPTVADPGDHLIAQILVYRGVVDTGNPWDVYGGGVKATASTSVTVTGVTTTVADTLVVVAVSQGVDTNSTDSFSGWTNANLTSISERADFGRNSGNGGGFGIIDGTLASAGATGDTTATTVSSANAFLTIALAPTTGPTPPPSGGYGETQCAGSRFGSNLNCTANDVLLTGLTSTDGVGSCVAGEFVTMNFQVTVNSGQPNRHDIGIFFSSDGKDPQMLPASGGASSCKVVILPYNESPWLNLDYGPHSGQYDYCGDVNGAMNSGSGSGILTVQSVTVKCQSKTGGSGKLYVPFILSWDQQASPTGKLCQSVRDPVPGTTSKCNAPTVEQATVANVIVLPKIEKSDGITVIDRGQNTSYNIVITNNTGATVSGAVFKDLAINNLQSYGVSCTATSGGATCPTTALTVANMQDDNVGVLIPDMPAGSSVTFTVTATVKNDTGINPDGASVTNTAKVTITFTVTVGNQTQTYTEENTASDTNTIGRTTLNHYELSLAASSVACEPATVTVTACAGTLSGSGPWSPCTNIYAGADIHTAPSNTPTLEVTSPPTGASLASTGPTFSTGVATTTLSYTTANNNDQAIVRLASVPTTNPVIDLDATTLCCRGGTCTQARSCITTFMRDALFIADTRGGGVANIPNQTAGTKSGEFFVRAVKTLSGGACDNALRGSVSIDFAYECNNPATCYPDGTDRMKIDTGPVTTIARNDNLTASKTYTPVTLDFDNNGYASFYHTFEDVGLVTLHTRYSSGGLTGASNAFVVKPYRFLLSNISCTDTACAGNTSKSNPGAADETGTAFVKAGSPFSVTVTAVATNISNATPSYGREEPAETVKLTPTLVAPNFSGTYNPAIENATAFAAPFSSGTATGTTFAWSEVGIIKLTPSVGDGNYLSAGDVIGNTSGNVGRFIPHHFKVTDTPGCGVGGTFTYSGQTFTATSTAQALGNTTTLNYTAPPPPLVSPVFARNTSFTDADTSYSADCVNNAMLAANYSAGVGTLSGIVCTFNAKESPPGITLRAAEVGGDGVTSADGGAGNGDDSMDLRSGRVRLFNANGSELLHLAVPMRVEHYVDTTITSPSTSPSTVGWIVNSADTCSAATLKTPTNCKRNLDACQADPALRETCVQDTGNPGVSGQGCTVTGSWELYTSLPTGGIYSLWLKAPGAGNYGSVDLAANLSSSMPWLQYDWDGDGNHTNDPVGTATFGTYRGNPRHIHIREIY